MHGNGTHTNWAGIVALALISATLTVCLAGCGGTNHESAPQKEPTRSEQSAQQEAQQDSTLLLGKWENERGYIIFDEGKIDVSGNIADYEIDEANKTITATNSNETVTFSYALDGNNLSVTLNGQTAKYKRAAGEPEDYKVVGYREVTFDNAVVVDNEYTKVELLRFYETKANGGTNKCFDIRVTNKTDNNCNVSYQWYLGDSDAHVAWTGNYSPAPGKNAVTECTVRADSSGTPLESLDQLYTLNGTMIWEVLSELKDGKYEQLDYLTFPISFEGVEGTES